MRQYLQQLLAANAENLRLDANETVAFARQLEQILAEPLRVEYPDFKFRQMFDTLRIDPDVRTWTYRQFENVAGQAKLVESWSDDFPSADEKGVEYTTPTKWYGSSYQYNVQEIREAAKLNVPLEADRARLAREMIERTFDIVSLSGDSAGNISGLFAPRTGAEWAMSQYAGGATGYTPTSVTQSANPSITWQDKLKFNSPNTNDGVQAIINDINQMKLGIRNGSLNMLGQTLRLVLPTSLYNLLDSTPRSIVYTTDNLMAYIKSQTGITDIVDWARLNTLSTSYTDRSATPHSGTYGRVLMYDPSPRVLKYCVPMDFEQFPPQISGLNFRVHCRGKLGGIQVYRPIGISFMDGADGVASGS